MTKNSSLQNNPLVKFMGGYTSDHAIQEIDISSQSVKIKGFTWNIQTRCVSKTKGGYANNPVACDESIEQYKQRLDAQIDIIIERMKNGHSFALLQEADFLNPRKYLSDQDNNRIDEITNLLKNNPNNNQYKAEKNAIFAPANQYVKDVIQKKLEDAGLSFFRPNGNGMHPGVLYIYKNKDIQPVENSGKSILQVGAKYRGYSQEFTVNGQNIVLCSVHAAMDSLEKHNKEIRAILTENAGKKLCVIGGDLNNPPNAGIQSMLGVDSVVSNIGYYEKDGKRLPTDTDHRDFTDQNGKNVKLKKKYDGFFVASGTEDVEVGLSGDCFKLSDNKVEISSYSDITTPKIPANIFYETENQYTPVTVPDQQKPANSINEKNVPKPQNSVQEAPKPQNAVITQPTTSQPASAGKPKKRGIGKLVGLITAMVATLVVGGLLAFAAFAVFSSLIAVAISIAVVVGMVVAAEVVLFKQAKTEYNKINKPVKTKQPKVNKQNQLKPKQQAQQNPAPTIPKQQQNSTFPVKAVQGNIMDQTINQKTAIIYGANSGLTAGGGTARIIPANHTWYKIEELAKANPDKFTEGRLKHGCAVITKSDVENRFIVHALSPSLNSGNHGNSSIADAKQFYGIEFKTFEEYAKHELSQPSEKTMLYSAVKQGLECAKQEGCTKVVLATLGTGFFKYNHAKANEILAKASVDFIKNNKDANMQIEICVFKGQHSQQNIDQINGFISQFNKKTTKSHLRSVNSHGGSL